MNRLGRLIGTLFPDVRVPVEDVVDQTASDAKQLADLFNTEIGEVEDVNTLMERAQEAGLEHQISMQRQNESLERESVTDGLTGLANRKRFDTELVKAYQDSRESGACVSVLFMDADNFKDVNDTHGHALGDAVLIELAQRIGRAIGSRGTVYRYGGEEFAAILPDADRAFAGELAEGVRDAVESPAFDLRHADDGPDELLMTISIGVSGTDFGPRDRISAAETIVKEADESVYRAKSEGRNRVVLWGDPEGDGSGAGGDANPAHELSRVDDEKSVMVFIEDDPLAATLVKSLFKRHSDPEIHWFTTGEDAVAFLQERIGRGECPCDLIISDMRLPGMHGLEVFEMFRSFGLHERIPFYILTAGDEQTRREIRGSGVSACITKAEFSKNIGKWLGILGSPARPAA